MQQGGQTIATNHSSAGGPSRPLAILGAFGGVNIGDEMILQAVVGMARRRGYRGPILLIGGRNQYGEAERQLLRQKELVFASWHDLPATLSALRGHDLFMGGGQLIDGTAGPKIPLLQLAIAAIAKGSGGRVFIGGVSNRNIDKGLAVRFLYRTLFGLADRISFRDTASQAEAQKLSPSHAARIGCDADVVFSMRDTLAGPLPARARKGIALVIHHAPHLQMTDRAKAVALLRRMVALAPADQPVMLVPHDLRAEYDLGFTRAMLDDLADPRVRLVELDGSAATIDFYRTVRSIVSLRMHPIILAACSGAFAAPLVYSRKLDDMASRLGLPRHDMDSLLALDDADFCAATGIADNGPLPDPAALDGLVAAAEGSFPSLGTAA